MSYDLYFRPRSGTVDAERFSAYFSGRPNYTVNLPQAVYENEDTGVYFVLEMQDADADRDAEEGERYPLALNVNFFRPSYFILEAEPEVSTFIQAFDLDVSDPQTHGMGDGEYDRDLLISGWNHGNEFAYSAFLRTPGYSQQGTHSLPTDVLMRAWEWNLNRNRLQEELGESRFVPRVMFLLLEGQVATAAVWPDGIPIAVPLVDYFIVPRKELAPKRLLIRVPDQALLAYADALPLFEKHRAADCAEALVLDYDLPPPDVVRFVKSLSKNGRALQGVAADQVLNRELVEKARG